MSRFRGGRARRAAPRPAPLTVMCGPCGARFATQVELGVHQRAGCLTAPTPAAVAAGPNLLSQVTVAIADRTPAARRAGVMYLIQRCALDLNPGQRMRLALVLDELCDLMPKEAAL